MKKKKKRRKVKKNFFLLLCLGVGGVITFFLNKNKESDLFDLIFFSVNKFFKYCFYYYFLFIIIVY
jgi:hypothetical protein